MSRNSNRSMICFQITKYPIRQKEVRKIKQPKRLTLAQKKILSRCKRKIVAENWMCKFEDEQYLHIIHKKSGLVLIVDKAAGETVKSNYKPKISSASNQTKRN